MSAWDELPANEQARRQAERQRSHGSVAVERRLAVEDARTDLMLGIIDWLRERGHEAAAADLEANGFEERV